MDQSSKTLKINILKAIKEKPQIKKLIQEAVLVDDNPIFDKKYQNRIENIKQSEALDKQQNFLDELKGKIPNQDFNILKASIYVKEQFDLRNPDADMLKAGIRQRYGVRGNNICNLYSEGYFQSLIIPFYREMSAQAGFELKTFKRVYEVIVTQSAFSVFINARMSQKDILKTIRAQLVRNIKLRQHYINIHGIGKEVIKRIRAAVTDLEEEKAHVFSTTERTTGIAITVRLTLLSNTSEESPSLA